MGRFTNWLLGDEYIEEVREATSTETIVTDQVDDVLLKALLNGETITKDKALTLPAVSSCVDDISNLAAICQIKLYQETIDTKGKKKVSEILKDKRVSLLNEETGDTLDAFQMKKAVIKDYLLGKGGYIYINRSGNTIKSLHYVKEESVSLFKNTDNIFKTISFMVDGNRYENYQFIKLLRNTQDGGQGTSYLSEVSKLIESAYTTILYQLNLVKTGGNKKGFLKAQKHLSADAITSLKNAWANLYANNEANSCVVLNDGIDFTESSNTSVEMQLDESKKTFSDEINRVFHYSDDDSKLIKHAILPILSAFKSSVNSSMLLESEKENGYFFDFDIREISRANVKERYEAYKIAKETGWMTINEIRYEENKNAINGMDIIPMNLADVIFNTETGEYYTPNTNALTKLDNEASSPLLDSQEKGEINEN